MIDQVVEPALVPLALIYRSLSTKTVLSAFQGRFSTGLKTGASS